MDHRLRCFKMRSAQKRTHHPPFRPLNAGNTDDVIYEAKFDESFSVDAQWFIDKGRPLQRLLGDYAILIGIHASLLLVT